MHADRVGAHDLERAAINLRQRHVCFFEAVLCPCTDPHVLGDTPKTCISGILCKTRPATVPLPEIYGSTFRS